MHEFTLTDPSGNHIRVGRSVSPLALLMGITAVGGFDRC